MVGRSLGRRPRGRKRPNLWFERNLAHVGSDVGNQVYNPPNEGKEHVAKHMTQSQAAKAQKLAREYWTRYVIPFQ